MIKEGLYGFMQLKNKNILVSVIVPAYNEEKTLEKCLESIRQQIYKKIELIVIDDGSTDTTSKIAKKYADIFIKQEHLGPGVARNKAAEIAKGEILVFIDADMYLDNLYIEKIIRPILERKAKATFTKEEYNANPDNIWSRYFAIDNNLNVRNRIHPSKSNYDNKFRAITKQFFKQSKGYSEQFGYGEDTILNSHEALYATGAICYHYNPSTIKDVFLSARWMGRSTNIKPTINNILRYSIINSIRNSFKKRKQVNLFTFIFYKIVFDLGITWGIIDKNQIHNYAK